MIDLTSTTGVTAPWKKLPQWLFNQPHYVLERESPQRLTFYQTGRANSGLCHVVVTPDGEAISGWQASFGAAELFGKHANPLDLYQEILSYGRANNWTSLSLRHWPKCYQPRFYDVSVMALETLGFERQYQDLNYHVPITFWAPELAPNEKRRLTKCIKSGFVFRRIPPKEWDPFAYYDFIAANRAHKGYSLSMDANAFALMLIQRPQDHVIFGVFDEECLIAIAVCVLVSSRILYVYYPADDYTYRYISPNVMLYTEIVRWAMVNGFALVDYGTASMAGVRNEGLIKFKEKLGGYLSMKPSFIFRF
jgi:hypothetical protein